MSPEQHTDRQCQYQNSRGQRCPMLIDANHRPTHGVARPTLCAYHTDRPRAAVPRVEPEILAAELLAEINDFSTAGSVNFFLDNLAKQFAANVSHAATLSLWPTFPSCSSIASLLWRDSWTASKKLRRMRRLLASTPAFASKTVNLRHVAINKQAIAPRPLLLTRERLPAL